MAYVKNLQARSLNSAFLPELKSSSIKNQYRFSEHYSLSLLSLLTYHLSSQESGEYMCAPGSTFEDQNDL